MVVVACLEAVALIAVVWLLLRHSAVQEASWAHERRELLNRVQRPDHIPVAVPAGFTIPDPEPDNATEVGTITYLEGDDG